MKSLISYSIFFPLIVYLIVFAFNKDLWTSTGNVSFFWIYNLENIPIVLGVTIFFTLYIILIWVLLKFSNIFSYFQTKKLTSQVDKLKAELHDGQEGLLDKMAEAIGEVVGDFKKNMEEMVKKVKSENEKYTTQTMHEIKKILDKMEKWEKE